MTSSESTTAVLDPGEAQDASSNRFYRWLEGSLFAKIIAYTIHPVHIMLLLVLWIMLLVVHATVFELVGGNYTNGLSAMAASIVLLQQTHQHRAVRQLHSQHHELLRSLHDRLATRALTVTLRSTVRFAGTAPVDDGCPLHTEHPWAGVDTPDAELLGANGSVSRVELGGGVDAVCDLVAELAGLKDADAGSQ